MRVAAVIALAAVSASASPLDWLRIRTDDNSGHGGSANSGSTQRGVQVVTKSNGNCIAPVDRAAAGSKVGTVKCDQSEARWDLPEGGKGEITLSGNNKLSLGASQRDGGEITLVEAGKREGNNQFHIGEDGTISVNGFCLDVGGRNNLQAWKCARNNDNQQFEVRSGDRKGNNDHAASQTRKGEQGQGSRPSQTQKGEDAKETQKGDDQNQNDGEVRFPETISFTHTEYLSAPVHTEYQTKTENQTKHLTKTDTIYVTKTQEQQIAPVTVTQTPLPNTQTKTEYQTKTETKTETEAAAPVTETKTETKTETQQQAPVTITQSASTVYKTETKTQAPVTETKKVTVSASPITKTVTKTETQKETQQARPTTETKKDEHPAYPTYGQGTADKRPPAQTQGAGDHKGDEDWWSQGQNQGGDDKKEHY